MRAYKNLGLREYKCDKCENKMDRDITATINIEWEGFLKYNKEQIV